MTQIKMVPRKSEDQPSITVFSDDHGNVTGTAYTMSKDEVQYHLAITHLFQVILAIAFVIGVGLLWFSDHYPAQWMAACDSIDAVFHTGKSAPDYVKPTDWTKHAPTEYTADGRPCASHMCEGGYATKEDYEAAQKAQ